MNQEILKLSLIILLFGFMTAGCQKDDIFELNVGDKNAVIQKEVNGIEFKFCLLNEAGEPATVFNEGENFTFQFSIKNNVSKEIYFDPTLMNTQGFCEVHDKYSSYGIPYIKPTYINLIMPTAIKKGDAVDISIKWLPDNNEWTIGPINFTKGNSVLLKKGKYYTEFTHKFDFDTVKTEKLTFKINFEIE